MNRRKFLRAVGVHPISLIAWPVFERTVITRQNDRRILILTGSTVKINGSRSTRTWLEVPGRPLVRAPLLLQRGEALGLRLSIPARVPAGYVYIPAGRFLFGWHAEEQVRRIFNAVPQHPVTTRAYLIGRYEVTFGEWLRYLRTLSLVERAQRRLRVGAFWPQADLRLSEDRGTFTLEMKLSSQQFRAREDEPVVYATRSRRREQRWLRWPVSGVRFADAEAYAAWLSKSGHLPGARLCDEYEWERAARGADGRSYPHGAELAADDANFDETYGRVPGAYGPDEVGSHPASDSPFGVSDMVGNVWEWVRPVTNQAASAIRSGSWYQGSRTALTINREFGESSLAEVTIGFRVCAAADDGEW